MGILLLRVLEIIFPVPLRRNKEEREREKERERDRERQREEERKTKPNAYKVVQRPGDHTYRCL